MRGVCRTLFAAGVLFVLAVPARAAREPVAEVILSVANEQGATAAIGTYLHLKKTAANRYDFSEPQLNAVAYHLLQNKRLDDAIAIFELNIAMFPRSANARDSLADAYARAGDLDAARREYQRALSMLNRGDAAPSKRSAAFLKANIRRQLERLRRYPIYEPLAGVYRTDDGRAISISIAEANFGATPPALRLTELPSGRVRTLHERDESSYFAGLTLDDRSQAQLRLDFTPGDEGRAASLTITEGGAVARAIRLPVPPTEKVAFRSGVAELEGTLSLPSSGGRHPAVILVHGSGKATRDTPGFGELANVLVLQGFAVLRYDKRGWGESTFGETAYPFLDDLARDAASAVRYLRSRGEIDPSRVGLLGFSEGAWVAGITASHYPRDVAFLVLLSGGGVAPAAQELYRVRAEMEAAGFAGETIAEASEYMEMKFDVARTGAGWEQYASRARNLRGRPWMSYTGRWSSLQFAQAAWQQALGYDPPARLSQIENPVLAILGERDLLTPVDETASSLRESFSGERSSLLHVAVVPRANHLMLESTSGAIRFRQSELPRLERYAPGYFDTLIAWLGTWCDERSE
ncbi:MAG: alpha/beta fold hydrolase [Thermoanaerobaculia bacterium]|nr:alpha/beta fold hydrolase [Thermoanaerobaculia bacterium]